MMASTSPAPSHSAFEHLPGELARERAVLDAGDQRAELRGGNRACGDVEFGLVQRGGEFAHHPVGGELGLAAGVGGGLEIVGERARSGQHGRVVGRHAVVALEARLHRGRQFGQGGAHRVDPVLVEPHRQQVGVGEVAVVVRLFLAAHHARLAAVGVEQHGGLLDAAAVLQRLDLPADFVVDRLLQEAERVEVLDLAAGAEFRLPDRAHRDVGVDAEAAFLHVAVADADPGHQRVQRAGVGHGLGAGAHLRLGDDFQQRRAGAVEVDAGHAVEVLVQRLAGVLFQVGAGEVDASFPPSPRDPRARRPRRWASQLADLVALGQVGVEVVLAVEHVDAVERRADRQAELDRAFAPRPCSAPAARRAARYRPRSPACWAPRRRRCCCRRKSSIGWRAGCGLPAR